jgi:glycine/D-amino acid oxidase-like deaminating enzyme
MTKAGSSHRQTVCAVGASYEHRPWDPQRATSANVARVQRLWARLTGLQLSPRHLGRWRGVRAIAPDRIPVVGPLYDANGRRLRDVWLNLAHGSAGTASIPLAAELIASELSGEIAPVSADVQQALSALRFWQRRLRRAGKPVSSESRGTHAR